jgi:hypothetical protein
LHDWYFTVRSLKDLVVAFSPLAAISPAIQELHGASTESRVAGPLRIELKRHTALGVAWTVEMVLSGGVLTEPNRFRDVRILCQVPVLVDLKSIGLPALEVAMIDEVLSAGTDAAVADAVGDIRVGRQLEAFVDLDHGQQGTDHCLEVFVGHVHPRFAARGRKVEHAFDDFERWEISPTCLLRVFCWLW